MGATNLFTDLSGLRGGSREAQAALTVTLDAFTLSADGTVTTPDPVATMITALLAATSWHALYVARTDLATSKQDLSGNALHLTAAGSEPTYDADDVGGRPALLFAGSHTIQNLSFPNVNGTRIGMVIVGIADASGGGMAAIGGDVLDLPAFRSDTNVQIFNQFATADFQIATGNAGDTNPHCWALWQRAASNDAEVDGVAFGTDFTGNAVLDVDTTNKIRIGRWGVAEGTCKLSVVGVMASPDATKIAAIESAIATCYGITFS